VNNKKFILRKKIGVVVLKNFPTVIHYHSWWWHRDLETIITKRTPIIEHTYFLPHFDLCNNDFWQTKNKAGLSGESFISTVLYTNIL